MQENESNTDENNILNESENHDLVLNDEAQKALNKSFNNYIISNGLIILVPLYIAVFLYCKINNIEAESSLYWKVLISPSFFIPVLIAVFFKDILKYIFCGMGKYDAKYIEEAEKENPKAKGIGEILNAKTAQKRFAFISLLFGLIGILFCVLIRQILNLKTLISFIIAYFYAAHKFAFHYSDFQHIILNKTFLIVFFVSLCVMNIFFKNKKNNSEQSSESECTDIFQQVQNLIDNEQFEDAVKVMLSVDLHNNHYLEASKFHKIAQCYGNMYNDIKALEYYNKALDNYLLCKDFDDISKQGMLMHSIAQCYEHTEDYQNALEYYNKAIELQPDRGDFLFNKARTLEMTGNIADAMVLMDKVIDMESNNIHDLITYYSIIVLWYNKSGDCETALKYTDKIIELEPNNTFALTFKADYHYSIGNTEKVIYYCNKILDLGSDSVGRIYQMLADCNAYLKNYQKAFDCYNSAIDYWTNFKYKDSAFDIQATLAYLYFGAGCSLFAMKKNLNEALRLINKAKELGFDELQCDDKINKIINYKENS